MSLRAILKTLSSKRALGLISQHGLQDEVRLLGFCNREQLGAMFARKATCSSCQVSLEEPFGKVQIEAQAAGLAVVRTPVGGYEDMIVDEVTDCSPNQRTRRISLSSSTCSTKIGTFSNDWASKAKSTPSASARNIQSSSSKRFSKSSSKSRAAEVRRER